jgi:phosphoserine phosphatase
MAESHWLAQRASRLQYYSVSPMGGEIKDEKKFLLYQRNQTTHNRAFHKSLGALLKLRAERRKTEVGFEAQKVKTEQHEMKKQTHYWTVLKKEGAACHQISANALQNLRAQAEFPGFEAQYAAELAKHNLEVTKMEVATA